MSEFRCGFAALVGRPNVGKSTLLNALVGEKLSIVTPRPQTTRHRILGLSHFPDVQIAWVDTPGLHQGQRRALNRAMNRIAATALADADVIVLVLEALRWTEDDARILERIIEQQRPVIAVINKIDRVEPREKLLPWMATLAQRYAFAALIPLCALRGEHLPALVAEISKLLPHSPPLFDTTDRTDRSLAFRITECIREKLTLELNQEVPYGIAVEIEQQVVEEQRICIDAIIWVDRDGQKPIVIGPKGQRLKRVGRAARIELNKLLPQRVHLNLWVKVRNNWADNPQEVQRLGVE
jgi:GTPase